VLPTQTQNETKLQRGQQALGKQNTTHAQSRKRLVSLCVSLTGGGGGGGGCEISDLPKWNITFIINRRKMFTPLLAEVRRQFD
jgi:hypothetical protein